MELDLENEFADRAWPLIASLVMPRPIALVATISAAGNLPAIATMTFEHYQWPRIAFVSGFAANAAAGEWKFHGHTL
ncbi:MAG TPA: hypothetical protein VGH42_09440 [Verrucomicrobiae bacterium]|jgi:hypothetical protein